MNQAISNLLTAQKNAMSHRPSVGGFPYLAEVLRSAGITKNIWHLPSCQSLYLTNLGPVIQQSAPLATGNLEVPSFNQEALIHAIRTDQAGKSSFPEFLEATWKAGVVHYDVDFIKRTVSYYGCYDEVYVEEYPAVDLEG